MPRDYLSLKWGGIKSYRVMSQKFKDALKALEDAGWGKGGESAKPELRKLLCEAIDAGNFRRVMLEWDGKNVTKEEAKKYVMEYPI